MRRLEIHPWHEYDHKVSSGTFCLIRLDADWHHSRNAKFFCLTFGLLGASVAITYWPAGVPK